MQETIRLESRECDTSSERQRFLCPYCGKHTVLWLLPNTEIKNLPIKCKLCGKEGVVSITPIAEP